MRLSHVSIKNFRSIADATINFDLACRILVGINESGKTNVLRALSLLDPNTLPKEDDIREFAPNEDPSQEAYVRFIFTLDKKEKLEAYEQVALIAVFNRTSRHNHNEQTSPRYLRER